MQRARCHIFVSLLFFVPRGRNFSSSFPLFYSLVVYMSSLTRRPVKVVTDSEDDQSDIRTRSDFHITSRKSANGAAAGDKQEDKKKQRYAYLGLKHTLPIHTITKASVLSKEAPPENYSGFIRLGSRCRLLGGAGFCRHRVRL